MRYGLPGWCRYSTVLMFFEPGARSRARSWAGFMRVITGSARGRRLKGIPGLAVRPTADRVKAALFSALGSRYDLSGMTLLDLYAGTGSVGIEALSRGAAAVVFVEQHRGARRVLQANLESCGFTARAEIVSLSVRRALCELSSQGPRFDGALVDPPYGRALLGETLEQLGRAGILRPGGWVMAERHVDDPIAEAYGEIRLTQSRRYGKTTLALFTVNDATDKVVLR